MTRSLPITLQPLHSEDLDGTGKVEVRADFHSQWRHDAMLEGVVRRMSLEPEITAVSWHVAHNDEQ
jgi:putative Mg2+ transporter-C (MgtC) family protein